MSEIRYKKGNEIIFCYDCEKNFYNNDWLMVLHDIFFHFSIKAIKRTSLYWNWWWKFKHVNYPGTYYDEQGVLKELTINEGHLFRYLLPTLLMNL